MKTETQRIKDAAWGVVTDPRANRMEVLIALQLVAACKGLLLPALDEQFLSVRQVAQLRRVQQDLAEKALQRKLRKKKANRKQYLKHKIRQLEQKEENVTE